MAHITGDYNATLLDLTEIYEEASAMPRDMIHKRIASDPPSEGEAYIKIPIMSRKSWPGLWDGNLNPESTEVAINQEYDKGTWVDSMGFDSDLVQESKAYRWQDIVEEQARTDTFFPSYNMTAMIVNGSNSTAAAEAYDGVAFYATSGHSWAGLGKNTFGNVVQGTGTTTTAMMADLQSALALIQLAQDDKSKLLNPAARYGRGVLLIHSAVSLANNWYYILHNSIIPLTAPVTTSGTAAVSGSGPANNPAFDGIADLYLDGYFDVLTWPTTLSGSINGKHCWCLHYIEMPQKPMIYSESYALRTKVMGIGSEYEATTHQNAIIAKQRWTEGYYRFDRSVLVWNT
jgi:hypothetical protein